MWQEMLAGGGRGYKMVLPPNRGLFLPVENGCGEQSRDVIIKSQVGCGRPISACLFGFFLQPHLPWESMWIWSNLNLRCWQWSDGKHKGVVEMKATKPEDGKGRHAEKRGLRKGIEKVERLGSVGPIGVQEWLEWRYLKTWPGNVESGGLRMGQTTLLLENDHLLVLRRWKMKVGMRDCLGTGLLEEGACEPRGQWSDGLAWYWTQWGASQI